MNKNNPIVSALRTQFKVQQQNKQKQVILKQLEGVKYG